MIVFVETFKNINLYDLTEAVEILANLANDVEFKCPLVSKYP